MSVGADTRTRSDFAVLCREIRAAGLLERRRVSYAVRIAFTVAAFAATWLAFFWVGNSWLQTIVAAVLGLTSTQIAFLGHDGGHQQVARSRRANAALGLITGDLLIGLSYGWWIDKHNRHHAHPNHEGQDPDIGDGVLAFTTEQAAARRGPLGRFVTRYQAWLFFPLLTLEGVNLHVQSFAWLWNGAVRKYRRIEIVLVGIHTITYLAVLFLVLSPAKAIVFLCIHQAVWGLYMGCSFAPNHKGMPTIAEDDDVDYLRRQVLTARNVRGGWLTDLTLGGLNYQIEHHLFPNMPRANLRHAQPIVQAFCRDRKIGYVEVSLIGSYAAALRHLHALGEPLRAQRN